MVHWAVTTPLLILLAGDVSDTVYSSGGEISTVSVIGYLCVAIGMWPMLTKAGRAGWGGFIPIWNKYLQIKLAGYSGWLILLYLIPIVNLVLEIVVAVGVARAFGKGGLYGFFLLFVLQPLGYLVLGFSNASYAEVRR